MYDFIESLPETFLPVAVSIRSRRFEALSRINSSKESDRKISGLILCVFRISSNRVCSIFVVFSILAKYSLGAFPPIIRLVLAESGALLTELYRSLRLYLFSQTVQYALQTLTKNEFIQKLGQGAGTRYQLVFKPIFQMFTDLPTGAADLPECADIPLEKLYPELITLHLFDQVSREIFPSKDRIAMQ